jgi:hypothetical protein
MSSSSMMTSPRLMPMRNWIQRAGGTSALRRIIRRWTSAAHWTASVTLRNSTSIPSPAVLITRPLFFAIAGSISSRRCVLSRASVPLSSASISRL